MASSIIHSLGVELPGLLVPADSHNPLGYWEWRDIVDQQEALLKAFDRWWPGPSGILPLPDGWLSSPTALPFVATIESLLRREFSISSHSCFVIQDPRSSCLLAMWRELARRLNLELKIIWAIRHPAEVVQSLYSRDSCLSGMTVERAELLWRKYNLDISRDSHVLPVFLLDYGRWFLNPVDQLEELMDFCNVPLSLLKAWSVVSGLVNRDFYRSSSTLYEDQLDVSTLRIYFDLVAASLRRDSPPAHPFLLGDSVAP